MDGWMDDGQTEHRLVIATGDGSLLRYTIEDAPGFGIQLEDSRKAFTKRPLSQLEIFPDGNGFLCLSGNEVFCVIV
jgi:hypothetical protein